MHLQHSLDVVISVSNKKVGKYEALSLCYNLVDENVLRIFSFYVFHPRNLALGLKVHQSPLPRISNTLNPELLYYRSHVCQKMSIFRAQLYKIILNMAITEILLYDHYMSVLL